MLRSLTHVPYSNPRTLSLGDLTLLLTMLPFFSLAIIQLATQPTTYGHRSKRTPVPVCSLKLSFEPVDY
ncbi:hypothetical protein EJ06DRAFT_65200 [Trichodelitschia bisporula]|uniref:Uncharacterized protein n=1 Tax=Trichodelitschia bisporula TaxID=703511 RepID=A0A6G1HSU8_9PEZI|nr:hypothetical protein EJ06DRAFT_65200 [Trichodelitschia bisporula]